MEEKPKTTEELVANEMATLSPEELKQLAQGKPEDIKPTPIEKNA